MNTTDPPGQEPVTPAPSPASSRRTIALAAGLGAAAVVVALAIVVAALFAFGSDDQPETFQILGAITLEDSITTSGLPDGFECAGRGGYDDIGPGAAVTVKDEAGTLLAKGAISESERVLAGLHCAGRSAWQRVLQDRGQPSR